MTPEEKLFKHIYSQVCKYSDGDLKIICSEYGISYRWYSFSVRKKLTIAIISSMKPDEYNYLIKILK
jgi:hypothetical protein